VTKSRRIIRQRHKARNGGGGREEKMHIQVCLKKLKEGAYLEDVNIYGGIILIWTLSLIYVRSVDSTTGSDVGILSTSVKTWKPKISCSVCHGIITVVTITIITTAVVFDYGRIKFEKYSKTLCYELLTLTGTYL
jgi:hypothetical protein